MEDFHGNWGIRRTDGYSRDFLVDIFGETEAETIVQRERGMSTEHVGVDLLRSEATVRIPEEVLERAELELRRIDFIRECRESRDPRKNTRFSGSVPVLDVDKLIGDIMGVRDEFLNTQMNVVTTSCMEAKLQRIFHQFLNFGSEYTKYI
jgi:hypothetical protein